MKKIRIITLSFTIMFLVAFFSACSGFLDPLNDGTLTEEQIFDNAAYFTGPLMDVYNAIDTQYNINLENMTDNSVDNDFIGDYYRCAVGGLRPDSNPLDNWVNAYAQIRKVNQFLAKMVFTPGAKLPTPVRFYVINTPQDSIDNVREFYRLLGEAYFMRAYWQSTVLKHFAGVALNGEILGVPIVGDKILEVKDKMNLPRAPYTECVKAIVNDCDSAIKYLPVEYKGTDRVIGESMNGRAAGISAMALKARVLLYAASPAYNPNNDLTLWEKAAVAAGDAIKAVGGALNLSALPDYYFLQLNNKRYVNRDILFRSQILAGNNTYESNNYPRSMYGIANNSPSQNFVDAFPDKNGYPLGESNFDFSRDPYVNRDPRLSLYIAYNGAKMGPGGYHTIASYNGGVDCYNPLNKTSRTSYYLKKLLRTDMVTLETGNVTSTQRVNIILGMPELYLNYAEAANEAWGVKSDPKNYGFTAYSILRKIQTRYGCSANYLDNVIKDDANKFRIYIRNERRIELSFEGHYYFDLRRWIRDKSTETLNKDIYGMEIIRHDDGTYKYKKVLLEKRFFSSPFQPLPYMELANSPVLIQNYGWK